MSVPKQTLREKLEEELDTTDWDALLPHHERGALVLVSEELALLDVAVKVAEGNLQQVQAWMTSGHLTKPTAAQIQTWSQSKQTPFQFLIVQPWVFAQLKAN